MNEFMLYKCKSFTADYYKTFEESYEALKKSPDGDYIISRFVKNNKYIRRLGIYSVKNSKIINIWRRENNE